MPADPAVPIGGIGEPGVPPIAPALGQRLLHAHRAHALRDSAVLPGRAHGRPLRFAAWTRPQRSSPAGARSSGRRRHGGARHRRARAGLGLPAARRAHAHPPRRSARGIDQWRLPRDRRLPQGLVVDRGRTPDRAGLRHDVGRRRRRVGVRARLQWGRPRPSGASRQPWGAGRRSSSLPTDARRASRG